MEKLPKAGDRDSYLQKRREERGRPPLSLYLRRRQGKELRGNLKDNWEDEVPEWQEEDQVSSYHTFVRIPTSTTAFYTCSSANYEIDNPLWPKLQRTKD